MHPADTYRIVLSTCPDQDTARGIAAALVERGLAACVNVLPGLESVYIWRGQREVSSEVLLLIKTRADRYADIEQAIRELHPYELPEVVAVPISAGLPDYLSWIDQAVKGPQ